MVTKITSVLDNLRRTVRAGGLEKQELIILEEQVSLLHADIELALQKARGR